jgi:hypothetical protein
VRRYARESSPRSLVVEHFCQDRIAQVIGRTELLNFNFATPITIENGPYYIEHGRDFFWCVLVVHVPKSLDDGPAQLALVETARAVFIPEAKPL